MKMDELKNFKTKLQFILSSLPSSEKAVAAYLIDNLPHIGDMKLSDLADNSKLSPSSVLRLCKRMGYNGYSDFRDDLKLAAVHSASDTHEPIAHDSPQNLMNMIVQKNIQTMRNTMALISDQYDEVVSVLQQAKVICMYGNGDAIIPCESIRIKLMKLGKSCTIYSDQDLQMFSALAADPGSVMIAVSHTGRTRSVCEAMRIASERGATTIAITANAKGSLLKYCRYVLYAGTIDESDSGDIISRRIAESLILETLYAGIISGAHDMVNIRREGAETIEKMMKIAPERLEHFS